MKLIALFISIFICLKLSFSVPRSENEVEMIVDVVKSYDRPTTVIGKLCWKMEQKKNLTIHLAKMPNPKMIMFVKENAKKLQILVPKDIILVVDITCHDIGDFFKLANEHNMFKLPFRWLFVGTPAADERSTIHTVTIPSKLNDLNISWNSEVIVSQYDDFNGTFFELYLIYKIKSQNNWLTEYFGTWSFNGFHKSRKMDITFQMRRKNLAGEPLACSSALTDVRTKDRLLEIREQVDATVKCSYQQLNPIYDFINATLVNKYTNNWGYFVNGSWNGMIGELISGKAEICGNILYITEERLDVIDFLPSMIQLSLLFVFREPPLSYQNNLYLLPFKTTIWYCTGGFAIMFIFILYIIGKWEMKKIHYESNQKITEDSPSRLTFIDIAMLVICAVTQHGGFDAPKGTIGRFVTFILFLTFLFLFTAYSASIVMLLQSSSDQIRTLSDLLHSKLDVGVEDTAYNRPYFMAATEPLHKAIYDTKVAPRGSKPNFISLEEGVRKMQKSPFAFYMPTGTGYRVVEKYFLEHEKCTLQEIAYNPPYQTSLGIKKNSPYIELFKIGHYRIIENGIAKREQLRFLARKPTCAARGGNFDSVNITDMYPVLVLLFSGMVLAFSVLIIEILVHRRQFSLRLRLHELK